jgi:hypothetical protein
MPIVNNYPNVIKEYSAVRLARYAQIVGYDENPFWGINHNVGENQCRYIWSLADRLMVAKYLGEAQREVENNIGFLIGRQWTVERKKPLKCPTFARWGHLRALGIKGVSIIASSEAVDHTSDPAAIGPIATTVTDPEEIVIFHPGTDMEIDPSSIVISGGSVTIEIPLCRMVIATFVDNPSAGWDYGDYDTWGEQTVDVKRVYNDTSTQAHLISNHPCNSACYSTGCSEFSTEACGYISDPEIGIIELYPAEYSGGTWTRSRGNCHCNGWEQEQLNYMSGVDLDYNIEDAGFQVEDIIVRLAHSKMPKEPCGCDPLKAMWNRDRLVSDFNTRERINCPFGMSEGAWTAWHWVMNTKLERGGIVA